MTIQTIQQQYAKTVYEQVLEFDKAHSGKEDKARKEYGSMAHKLPVLVRQAGLVQALVFVATRGKGKDSQKEFLEHLAQTMGAGSFGDLLDQVRTAPLVEYMLLTRQTLWALEWYKRFAQSVLGIDPTEEGD